MNHADVIEKEPERRSRGADRRQRTFRSLLHGSLEPRRRAPRREDDRSITSVDWHHPQWLAVAIITLLLCSADAFFTLILLGRGATEANPIMRPLVGGSPLVFTLIKFGMTAGGITVLILLARMRVFRLRLPVSFLLYGVLFAYTALVAYEFWLLENIFPGPL